jgi:hypothetical protein
METAHDLRATLAAPLLLASHCSLQRAGLLLVVATHALLSTYHGHVAANVPMPNHQLCTTVSGPINTASIQILNPSQTVKTTLQLHCS